MKKRAVLYARVSGDDRTNSTSSIEGQLEMCREYANEQGWQIVAELAEDDRRLTSGASWNLPEMNRALELAQNGKSDVLVLREMDRFARNLAKQLVIEEEFKRAGVDVVYVLEEYADTPEGRLNKHVRATIAEYEREKTRERMLRGRRRKAKSGSVVVHGNVLYGYKKVTKDGRVMLIIDEEIAKIIRMIFDHYIVDGLGTTKIALKLNEMGIPAPSVAKNVKTTQAIRGWSHSTVNRILQNEAYCGTWRYGKRNRKGHNPKDYHIIVNIPAIVSREVYERAQKQRKRNTNFSKRNTKREYLLARICRCGECNTPMVGAAHWGGKRYYSYYRCPVHQNQVTHYVHKQCEMKTFFRSDYWDSVIWEEIDNFLANPDKFAKGFRSYRQEQEAVNEPTYQRIKLIDKLILEREQEQERLLDAYLSGKFDMDLLLDRKQRLEETLQSLRTERESLVVELSQTLTHDQITELVDFAKAIQQGLEEAGDDFKTRRQIVEYLNVKVVFAVEDEQQVAFLSCSFGLKKRLTLNGLVPAQNSSRLQESEPSTNSHEGVKDNYMLIDMHNMDCRQNSGRF